LFGFSSSEMLLPVSTYIAGLCLTAGASLRYAKLKDLSLQDWLVFVFQLHVLPWVMGYSLLRGWFDFRGEPEYLAG
jgi:hypothetical protein